MLRQANLFTHSLGGTNLKSLLAVSLFLAILFLGFSNIGYALGSISLTEDAQFVSLVNAVELVTDRDKSFSLDQIIAGDVSAPRESIEKMPFARGVNDHVFWLHFILKNQTESIETWWLVNQFIWVGETEVYSRKLTEPSSGPWKKQVSSVFTPYKDRSVPNQLIIEPLTFAPLETKEIWIRYDGQYSVVHYELVRPHFFLEQQQTTMILIGAYVGLALLMVLINGFLGFAIRSRAHFYYILYTLSIAFYLLCTEGLAYRYLWPESPRWQQTVDVFMVGIAFFWGTLMTIEFLGLRQNNKKIYQFLLVYLTLFISTAIVYLFFPHYLLAALVNSLIVPFVISYIWASYYRLKEGYEPAKYYLFGTGVLLTSVILKVLVALIPMPFPGFFIASMYWGSSIELLILSYALSLQVFYIYKANLQYQEKLQKANFELIHLDKEKDTFMSNISHELRTPLHGMIGITQGMIEQKGMEKDLEKLNMVVQSGIRLTGLVNDILEFNRIKVEGVHIEFTPINFHSLQKLIFAHFQESLKSKQLTFASVIPNNLPFILGDEERLQQILFNLVGNAIKFTTKGTITLGATKKGKEVDIWVQDTGIGIPQEELETLFKPYQQGKAAKSLNAEGTGLGLALTKSLVELHKSQLQVSSHPGKGSRFFFALKVAVTKETYGFERDEVTTTEYFDQKKAEEIKAIPKDGLLIQVVDDDVINRQVVKSYLEPADYQIIEAQDGFEALRQLEAQKPDLILLDIMMPQLSGFEVCSQIREKYSMQELPIIFLTAKTQVRDLALGLSIGGNDYLNKPFQKEELLFKLSLQLSGVSFGKGHSALQKFSQKIFTFKTASQVYQESFKLLQSQIESNDSGLFDLSYSKIQGKVLKGVQFSALIKLCGDQRLKIFDSLEKEFCLEFFDEATSEFLKGGQLLIGQHEEVFVVLYRKQGRHFFNRLDVEFLDFTLQKVEGYLDHKQILESDKAIEQVVDFIDSNYTQVSRICAESPYCQIYMQGKKVTSLEVRLPFWKLVKFLKPYCNLVQIHRSHCVNPNWVAQANLEKGKFLLQMQGMKPTEAIPFAKPLIEEFQTTFPSWFSSTILEKS